MALPIFLFELIKQEIAHICVNFADICVYFFLQFLENEDFAWGFGEPTDADFLQLIIFEECFGSNELPPLLFLHFFNYLIVPVVSHIGVPGSEDNVSTLLTRKQHLFKDQVVHEIVVDQSGTCYKVMLIFEFLREEVRVLT